MLVAFDSGNLLILLIFRLKFWTLLALFVTLFDVELDLDKFFATREVIFTVAFFELDPLIFKSVWKVELFLVFDAEEEFNFEEEPVVEVKSFVEFELLVVNSSVDCPKDKVAIDVELIVAELMFEVDDSVVEVAVVICVVFVVVVVVDGVDLVELEVVLES